MVDNAEMEPLQILRRLLYVLLRLSYSAYTLGRQKSCSRSGMIVSAQRLQVQDAVADLLSTALVPELGADISAGAAGNIQL